MSVIPSDYIGGGKGKIAVKFHNGTEVVTGFILKQTGIRRFIVSDGGNQYTVHLARTLADLADLQPGKGTIEIFPYIGKTISTTPEHIHKIEQFVCYTVEGHRYGWRFDYHFQDGIGHPAHKDGEGNIAQVP
jgi:hypothetical protein